MNLITDQTKLTLTNSESDKDSFLYTVLKNFYPSAKFPCGLKGPVNERIRDCSDQINSEKEGFVLVTRTKELKEVHKDTRTDLLWSRLPSTMGHVSSEKVCNSSLAEVGKISGPTWRLPSKEEYEEVEINGIRKALPSMKDWFWSSSVDTNDSLSTQAWFFNGNKGKTSGYRRYSYINNVSSRCVAR